MCVCLTHEWSADTALSDCSQLTQLCSTGPEVAEPEWPVGPLSGLCVSLQGLDGRATEICCLSSLGDRLWSLAIYGEQRQRGQTVDIRAQGMADTQ